jgi:hypothetical protein
MEHPNAKTTWTTIKLSRDHTTGYQMMETVFIVETDLVLNANHPDYKKDAVDGLLAVANRYFADNAGRIDRIEIQTIKPE